jgi:NADH dehydrogenase (ubiquinone) Fe-S protein 1
MANKNQFLIGALTAKPYAFKARPWELKSVETIDLFESLNSNIRVDIRGSDVMRILPLNNEFLNEEWISDKTRHAYDGLKRRRFVNPMVKKNNFFLTTSWKEIISEIKNTLENRIFNNYLINTGNFNDFENLTALENFKNNFSRININNNDLLNVDFSSNYLINYSLLKPIGSKVFLFIGTNLRLENPVLNIRFKKLAQSEKILIGYIGPKYNYNLNMIHIGNTINILKKIFEAKHSFATLALMFSKRTNKNTKLKAIFRNNISLFFGSDFENQFEKNTIISFLKDVKFPKITFNLNVLKKYNGMINAAELGLYNTKKTYSANNNFVYLCGSESYVKKEHDFIVFQGHHNEKVKTEFDIILPSSTWLEKQALFMNCFGVIQKSKSIILPPINVRNDWRITEMLNHVYHQNSKFYQNINDIHYRLNQLSPNLTNSLNIYKDSYQINLDIDIKKTTTRKIRFSTMPFKTIISNYYQTSAVEKASKIMHSCALELNNKKNNFLKF